MHQVIAQKRKASDPVIPKRGRGRPRGDATQINVAIPQAQLDALDAWVAAQDEDIGRTEAIRRLIVLHCKIPERRGRKR